MILHVISKKESPLHKYSLNFKNKQNYFETIILCIGKLCVFICRCYLIRGHIVYTSCSTFIIRKHFKSKIYREK